jgi:hypothetical protein
MWDIYLGLSALGLPKAKKPRKRSATIKKCLKMAFRDTNFPRSL